MRKVVYTVITSAEYPLKELKVQNEGWDAICFTNQDIESSTWKIQQLDSDMEPQKLSRRVKIRYFDYLDHDLSIYLDSKFVVQIELDSLKVMQEQFDIAVMKHNMRSNVFQEGAYLLQKKIGDPAVLCQQMLDYARLTTELNGLYAPGIMIRKHNERVKKLMSVWFEEVEKYTYRDIMSLPYALSQCPVDLYPIPYFQKPKQRHRNIYEMFMKRPDKKEKDNYDNISANCFTPREAEQKRAKEQKRKQAEKRKLKRKGLKKHTY